VVGASQKAGRSIWARVQGPNGKLQIFNLQFAIQDQKTAAGCGGRTADGGDVAFPKKGER
jgi:hypothetical protein